MAQRQVSSGSLNNRGTLVLGGAFASLVVLELVLISFLYKDVVDFECASTGLTSICLKISEMPLRALGLFGVMFMVALARPQFFKGLWTERDTGFDARWLGLHIFGVILLAIPLLLLSNSMSQGMFITVIAFWLVGAAFAAFGAIFAMVTPGAILNQLKEAGWILGFAILLGFAAPEIARVAQFAWQWEFLREATYAGSEWVLRLFWTDVVANPTTHELGVGDFLVRVGEQCSGIEGFALITLFFVVYVALFHKFLRLGRVWILLPIGLMLSWITNIVRIASLISIGVVYSPEHAINGFHSHAGWFFFSILALTIATIAHSIVWFRKSDETPTIAARVPFLSDPVTAQILPFIAFMGSALLMSTFVEDGSLLYPLRLALVLAVLLLFFDYLKSLDWRIDPVAIGVGIVIGVLWLGFYQDSADAPLAATSLTGWAFAIWAITRVFGTTIVVPVIEELFFRGYLLGKFRNKSSLMLILGVAINSGIFAMMHGKWEMALVAGILLSLLVIRKDGRLVDAIVAHMVANALIAARAAQIGDWSLI